MKVRTLIRFSDLKENIVREVGDEFIVSKERFEILSALGPIICEVKEVAEDAAGKRKKGTKNK